MDNPAYMQEVMSAMETKHSETLVSTSCEMMKSDKATCEKMMGTMMDMCKTDTAVCKMMMGKTMEMCEMDKQKCEMMMTTMNKHPKVMQEINNNLVTSKKNAGKVDPNKVYSCPMHPEVKGKLNSKCSKCGMPLTDPVS